MTAVQTVPPSSASTLPFRRPKRIPPSLILPGTSNSTPTTSPPSPADAQILPTSCDIFPPKPRSSRNLKKLSLSIPTSPNPITSSGPVSPTADPAHASQPNAPTGHPSLRRPSIVSLPSVSTAAAFRRDEGESPSAPYPNGPVEIMPNIWIGTDDHARDWQGLREKGIRSIVNVAKELSCPFDSAPGSLRSTHSASDLITSHQHLESQPTFHPAHIPSGRPAFHYLKLPWSHGQTNLVKEGFPAAMSFVDTALSRGDGVLIHCQCGVSRSATLVIAIVMRAASLSSTSSPPEVAALKGGGMHAAYAFVKEKSKWVGPNMSLIYQLLDYERSLQSGSRSPVSSIHSSQVNEEELDWSQQRLALDHPSEDADTEHESTAFANEAKALDQEMEQRNVARKTSQSSFATTSSIVGGGNGAVWRSRYGFSSVVGRRRTGSTSSNLTTQSSILSEDVLEAEEDLYSARQSSSSTRLSPSTAATEDEVHRWNLEAPVSKDPRPSSLRTLSLPNPPPSAPVHRNGFSLPHRLSLKTRTKHRPSPLVGILPTVPSSPVPATAPIHEVNANMLPELVPTAHTVPVFRKRTESRKPAPPPLHLRARSRATGSFSSTASSNLSTIGTPSQTLFVFPPSPTGNPSTLMLTATPSVAVPFPVLSTPRISSRRLHGKTKGFISLGIPPTPTTAFSLVEVRGTIDTPIASRS